MFYIGGGDCLHDFRADARVVVAAKSAFHECVINVLTCECVNVLVLGAYKRFTNSRINELTN